MTDPEREAAKQTIETLTDVITGLTDIVVRLTEETTKALQRVKELQEHEEEV